MSLSSAPSIECFRNDISSDGNIRPITPSLKLRTADVTPISIICLEMNICSGHFFQIILLKASFRFCVVSSKHQVNKLSTRKSKNVGTSRSLITFGKLADDL